ncbi:hypothetical protein KCU83_g403, partial [Aureobasidium melanogenum]
MVPLPLADDSSSQTGGRTTMHICSDELGSQRFLVLEKIITEIQESLMKVTAHQGLVRNSISNQSADILSEAAAQIEIFIVARFESSNDFRVCIEASQGHVQEAKSANARIWKDFPCFLALVAR